jgi:integrase/RNA polymerase subunit RPABC4/transcription elongation factor Spt4
MPVDDPQKFSEGLQRQRELLLDSDAVHEADRDPIHRWVQQKDGTVAVSSLKTYLRRVRVASERSDTPLMDMDEPDFHDLVFSLRHGHDLEDSTIRSYENAVLLFIEDIVGAEWPEDVDRTTVERSTVSAEDLLTPADIQTLTETARHQRDVAFIEFLADTGARLSLALSLRIGDISLTKPPTYMPNADAKGLKGAPITEYPLIDAPAAIRSYVRTSHPRPNDSDVALFHKIKPASRPDEDGRWRDDGSIDPNAIRQQLARIADRAGVEKSVRPHAFRHAAVTRMVREGYSRSQIEHRVHWTLDTDMWETYEHITGAEHTEDIFREAGLIEGEDSPDKVRKPCGNCREPLAPHHEFCPLCGSPATEEARRTVESVRSEQFDTAVKSDDPSKRETVRDLAAVLDIEEELAERVVDARTD